MSANVSFGIFLETSEEDKNFVKPPESMLKMKLSPAIKTVWHEVLHKAAPIRKTKISLNFHLLIVVGFTVYKPQRKGRQAKPKATRWETAANEAKIGRR